LKAWLSYLIGYIPMLVLVTISLFVTIPSVLWILFLMGGGAIGAAIKQRHNPPKSKVEN
jgi:hypothetical protein